MPAHAGEDVRKYRTGLTADVWYRPDAEPVSRQVWGDGMRWYVMDRTGMELIAISDVSGWVLVAEGRHYECI